MNQVVEVQRVPGPFGQNLVQPGGLGVGPDMPGATAADGLTVPMPSLSQLSVATVAAALRKESMRGNSGQLDMSHAPRPSQERSPFSRVIEVCRKGFELLENFSRTTEKVIFATTFLAAGVFALSSGIWGLVTAGSIALGISAWHGRELVVESKQILNSDCATADKKGIESPTLEQEFETALQTKGSSIILKADAGEQLLIEGIQTTGDQDPIFAIRLSMLQPGAVGDGGEFVKLVHFVNALEAATAICSLVTKEGLSYGIITLKAANEIKPFARKAVPVAA